MEKKDASPLLPLFVTAKDIARIEQRSIPAAQAVLKRTKKLLGKASRSKKLTVKEYCDSRGISVGDVMPYLTPYLNPHLKILIVAAILTMTFAFGKILLEYSCEFFRKHTMIWEEHTENYLKGHTFVTDSLTGETTKQTIEIRKTEPQITVFGKDTIKTDTFINITAE